MALIKSISGIRGTIGGVAGENFTPVDIVKFTAAFAALLQKQSQKEAPLTMVVGRDARISGELLSRLVCATLQSMGVNVIDTGLSTTPTVEMSVTHLAADAGIILTASHNPMEWNALKLLKNNGEFISGDEARELLNIVDKEQYAFSNISSLGSYITYEKAIDDHIDTILRLPLVAVKEIEKANFKVTLDCVHSTGGLALPRLLERLGVNSVKTLYGEPTGHFPHNPEPLPEHLYKITEVMQKENFDVGFVVDPDVDRLSIVDENGNMFGEEYTLVAVADYILQHTKGNTVSNLSSTRALHDISEKYGVQYSAAAVGEVNVIAQMKATNAIIGGEGNGGVIYPELHYGRDALVGIALFLSYLAKSGKSCSQLRRQYPEYFISKNKIVLQPDMNIPVILQAIAEKYSDYKVSTIDGVKIDFEENWVHLRRSNTEPVIRIYAEAKALPIAENLAKKLMSDISEALRK
ncbi:MAG: phosphoglucosamine mutase [Bacteroidales bacterium]|jgi:phosphomannomutase|nr:phosphoglucosamine mutase [Bacteroidales bacterium]